MKTLIVAFVSLFAVAAFAAEGTTPPANTASETKTETTTTAQDGAKMNHKEHKKMTHKGNKMTKEKSEKTTTDAPAANTAAPATKSE